MLHTLGNHPAVEETLNEISEALKCDVRTFDSPEALRMTVPVQLALLAAGVATARTLRRSGLELSAVAGLSVGAFSAAVAADAISLAAAVTLVRSRAEQMEHLYPTATMLGAFAQWSSVEAETELRSGDCLAIYSDGVTEAGTISGEEFGEQRLESIMRAHKGCKAGVLVQTVVDAVSEFSRGSRDDDVTVVALRGI